ncbi:uncharacterized protein MELLADRAFT_63141 [Melampsora larici-populina 98AG31]|uniref:Secreted protein n=1 Tax=Melampsora larici-populina (strain 98AG31 / pathotype 3-4-7) TaxID=747676 RepID=F4RLK4_MELLP|nr:uncharacterized protein MELLADRAFT_63141 [Melampsora larici-populina 98AG31]EGG06551.1 hypothetical protein MELLADRAFT_63141 [Melampsora larici-populina 98AG31]
MRVLKIVRLLSFALRLIAGALVDIRITHVRDLSFLESPASSILVSFLATADLPQSRNKIEPLQKVESHPNVWTNLHHIIRMPSRQNRNEDIFMIINLLRFYREVFNSENPILVFLPNSQSSRLGRPDYNGNLSRASQFTKYSRSPTLRWLSNQVSSLLSEFFMARRQAGEI